MRIHHLFLATCLVAPAAAYCGDDGPAAKPRRKTYDERANATAQLDAAIARAKRDNKRVLVQWGANWCGWCHKLHDVCASDPTLQMELLYDYEVVLVDVGQFDKNLDLLERLGAQGAKQGIPYLTVLDGDGKPVTQQETGALEVGPAHDPAKVLAFLKEHAAKPLDAETVLADTLATAKSQNKLTFVRFGSPTCGWCHKLDDWIQTPDIAKLVATRTVEVKIDIARMTNGKAVKDRFCTDENSGIPWFAFLDAEGKPIATSTYGTDDNIGFPQSEEELKAFSTILDTAKFTPADRDTLLASLRTIRDAREAKK